MNVTTEMINRGVDAIPSKYWAHPWGSCTIRDRVAVLLSAALRDVPEPAKKVRCKNCGVRIEKEGTLPSSRWNHLSTAQPEYGIKYDGYSCKMSVAEPDA